MAGPWEKYQQDAAVEQSQPNQGGPWAKYQSAAQADSAASGAPEDQGGIEALDFAKETASGAFIGTGSMVSGIGDAVRPDPQARQPVVTPKGEFMLMGDLIGKHIVDPVRGVIADTIDGPASAAGEWLAGKGKALAESKSEAAKQALQASTPEGDISEPSTWGFGDDPSIAGYGLHAANLVGQFVPQAGALLATRGKSVQTPAMMGVGGLQAGGAAGNEVADRIDTTPDSDLQESSALYRQLRQSMGEQEARKSLKVAARNAAFDGAAPVGALGGLATQAALGPLQNSIGGSVGRRLAGSLLFDAPAEGAQEVAETVEARRATNKALGERRSLTEDTFGDAVLGTMGGAGHAALGTALSRPGEAVGPVEQGAEAAVDPAAPSTQETDVSEPPANQVAGLSIAELEARAEPAVDAEAGPDIAAEPEAPQPTADTEAREIELPQQAPQTSETGGETAEQGEAFTYLNRPSGEPFQAHGAARASKAFREAKKAGRSPTVSKVDGGFAVRVPADPQSYQMRPIDRAAHEAATSPNNDLPTPTQAQIEAGNYKKGRVRIQGLDISIENPKGSERSGTDPDGNQWRRTMSDHYGYIKRTQAADGEQLDVYVGPQQDSKQVFVVDQVDQQTGRFDEHKVMLGYPDQASAVEAYRSNFDEGWKVGPVTAMPVADFKGWINQGDLSKPLALPASVAQQAVPDNPGAPASAAPAEANAFLDPAEAQFSRGRDAKVEGPGLSALEAQRVADEFLAEFKGNVPLKLRVVEQQEEAYGPNGSRERIGTVKGAYHAASGQLVLAAANQLDASDARQTLRHEVVGHYGLNTFRPAEKRALLDRILETEKERSLKSAWEHVRRNYADAPREYQAEELFAYLAEQKQPPASAAWEKVLATLQRALRAVGLSDRPLTRAELRDMARSIARGIRSGERTQQTFPKTDQDQFRREGAPLREEIETALAATPELAGIKVVQSFDDLPSAVRNRIAQDGALPEDVGGVYRTGAQYLVADNQASLEDALRTAVHEMVGHRGIRGLLGDELNATMERIYSSEMTRATGRKRIEQIREHYAKVLKGKPPEQQRLIVAEEIIAHLAEEGERPSVLQRFVSKVRALLRQRYPQVKWSYNDVLGLIEQSREWLRSQQGRPAQGEKGAGESRYSLRASEQAPAKAEQEAQAAQEASLELPTETLARRVQRRYQDRLNRFTVIKQWMAKQGKQLSEDADVYLAEERMHSRFANKAKDFREQTVRPLVEKIQKAGYSMDDVAQYLHAQHAGERNAQIAKVNKAMPDGGSGMSNAEAGQILGQASPRLAALANQFREITDNTRKVLLDYGLIDKDAAAAWQKAYQHYVPLKGGPNEQAAKAGTGKGLSVKHKTKRALGHDVREGGEWIIENIIADHERALMAAEKNLVGQHLLKMALEVGVDDIMTIARPEKRAVLKDQVSFEVTYKGQPLGAFNSMEAARTFKAMAPSTMAKSSPADFAIRKTSDPSVAYMASPMPAPNEALVYVDGHVVRVQINDDLLARAYNNMGADALGTFLSAGRALNQYFSSVYTGYNPEFFVKNVARDFTTGLANITGEEGAVFAAKTAKNYFSAFGSLILYAFKGTPNKWIDMYRADGGNTGAAWLSDIERLGADVQTEYATYQGVTANLRKGSLKGAARAARRRAFNATLRHLEALNEAGENAMRLALYRTAIEQGSTRNRAASLAKNTTVNFNRKGELGAQANALWLFYNAGVQGSAAIAHAHFKGKHKYQAWGISSAMAALGYSLSMLAAGADEDEYEKTPEHVKDRNMVLPIPGTGEQVTIPVPYGYGFFFALGRGIADAQRTGEADELPWRLASSFIGEFTPFGSVVAGDEPDMKQATIFAMPTIGQIPLSIANNRTSFGSPMRPENSFKKHEPDRLKMWRGTEGTWADRLAGTLEAVGMDVSPETLKYLNRTFTGGAGNFVGSTVDAGLLGAQGATLETKEVPFLRSFYRENGVGDARSRFWRYQAKAGKAVEELDRAINAGDREQARGLLRGNRALIAMDDLSKDFSELASATRDRAQQIRLSDLPIAEKRAQIKKIEEREAELYDRFVRIFKEKTQKKE